MRAVQWFHFGGEKTKLKEIMKTKIVTIYECRPKWNVLLKMAEKNPDQPSHIWSLPGTRFLTSVSNWAPNMSMGLPFPKDGLCFSSQSLKEKGVITFMVFSWKGGSLKTSSIHPIINIDTSSKFTGTYNFLWTTHLDQVFLSCTAWMPWTWK